MLSLINIIGFVLGDTGKSIQELSTEELYQEIISNEPKYATIDNTMNMCELCIAISKKYGISSIKEIERYMSLHCNAPVILVTCYYYICKCEKDNLNMSESVDLFLEGLSEINAIIYKISVSIVTDYTKRSNGYNYPLAYSHAKRCLIHMNQISSAKLFATDVEWICKKLNVSIRNLDIDQAVLEIGNEYRYNMICIKDIAELYNTDSFDLIVSMIDKLSK